MRELEGARATKLREAQTKAEMLFLKIDGRGLIRPRITESKLNDEIYALAKQMYGIEVIGTNESSALAEAPCCLMQRIRLS